MFIHCNIIIYILKYSLTIEWMCGGRGGGVNMITDVLYSVNM